ncbi:hypothetical protein, partial [Fulvivirga aurantia]|uniref:hypothetical protein n=1 Tax=Fulvivirga aurantia TaxID=2529383 RepID=UPI001627BE90
KVLEELNTQDDSQYFRYRQLTQKDVNSDLMEVADVSISGDLFADGTPKANAMVYLTDQTGNVIDSTRS